MGIIVTRFHSYLPFSNPKIFIRVLAVGDRCSWNFRSKRQTIQKTPSVFKHDEAPRLIGTVIKIVF